MSYRSDGNAIPVVDCESGKKQGHCNGDKLNAEDQRIFQAACTRSCEECQINPRTHYQVKITSTEDSFALNGDEKIPVDITLRPESNKEESYVTISHATETVFDDDIACGSQLQFIIKPQQPYEHGDVDCIMKVVSEMGQMGSDGKVIMAGDLELTFTCINPHNPNPSSDEDNNPSSDEDSYFFDLVSSFENGRSTACASKGCSTELGLESCRQKCEDNASCNAFAFCPKRGSCSRTNRCCIRECSANNLKLTSRWGGWNVYAKRKGCSYSQTSGQICRNSPRITVDGFRGNDVTVETCQSLCNNHDDCVKINYYFGGICTVCGIPSRCYLITSAANAGCH